MKPTKPSLDNAYARADRAQQHLESLKRELDKAFANPSPIFSQLGDDMADGDFIIVDYSGRLLRPIWGILVGETVYNLRAALDYLVYELAILDSGQIEEYTQFPIEDRQGGWRRASVGLLCGFTDPHKESIKLLQPCYGCYWTKIIRDISNSDKHRSLKIVRPRQTIEWITDKDTTVTYEVTFDDEKPVIETLQELHARVTERD